MIKKTILGVSMVLVSMVALAGEPAEQDMELYKAKVAHLEKQMKYNKRKVEHTRQRLINAQVKKNERDIYMMTKLLEKYKTALKDTEEQLAELTTGQTKEKAALRVKHAREKVKDAEEALAKARALLKEAEADLAKLEKDKP